MSKKCVPMILLLILLPPYPLHGQPVEVDQPGVCFGCHADIEEQTSERHRHTAFEFGECSDCHNPHASKHATLLKEREADLCLSCHDEIGEELKRASVHSPARGGDCVRCHDPHASPNKGQLTQRMPDLCKDCHEPVNEWLQRSRIHSPVRAGNCSACHGTHGSENERLLRRSVPELCLDCHRRGSGFASAHQGRDVSKADCVACHDPHASNRRGLLRANQHAPFAGGQCNTCHPALANQGSFAVGENIKELCIRCHRGATEFEKERFHHNLDDARSCVNCHNPHASNTGSMLAAKQPILCMKCHFNTPEHGGKSQYITHNGIDCTTCHKPHGADNRKYLKSLDVDLCLGCHEAAHRSSHPVGPDVIDKRTGEPVTCLSCHRLHGSGFEKYLALDPQMDLCIQCHRK